MTSHGPITTLLEERARTRGDQAAVVAPERSVTYRELADRSARVAAALVASGVATGDLVAIVSGNSLPYVEAVLGAAMLGAVVVPVNYRLNADEVGGLLERVAPELVLVDEAHRALVVGWRGAQVNMGSTESRAEWDRWCAAAPAISLPEQTDPDFFLQSTSGTTGPSRLVPSKQDAWLRLAAIDTPFKDLTATSRYLGVMPFCHTGGMKWLIETLWVGGTTFLPDRFDAELAVELIVRERLTNLALVPTMLRRILDVLIANPTIDTSSLRSINSGGAPLQLDFLREVHDRIGCAFTQGYGMTEVAGGSITVLSADVHRRVVSGELDAEVLQSVGRALPDCRIWVADASGSEVPAGQVGEIHVQSDRVMEGYWGETGSPVGPGGVYATGDLGRFTSDGFLQVVGRAKEVIISGGVNVNPREVESALLAHPGVREAVVVGLPDRTWGELITGVIVPDDDGELDAESLSIFVRDRIAGFKCPKSYVFLREDDLPRTSLGKVQKHALVDFLVRAGNPGMDGEMSAS